MLSCFSLPNTMKHISNTKHAGMLGLEGERLDGGGSSAENTRFKGRDRHWDCSQQLA